MDTLLPSGKLKEDYIKINDNFTELKQEIDQISGNQLPAYYKTNILNYGSNLDNGSTNIYTALVSALNAAGTHGTIYFPNRGNSVYYLNTSLNMSSYGYITLEFEPGAVLKLTSGKVFTANFTRIEAGLTKIFDIPSSSCLAGIWLVEKGLPEWFGARADYSTDSTLGIQFCIDLFLATYLSLGTYVISDTIRERSNGGNRRIYGAGQDNTMVYAKNTMIGKPMFWLGNSSGHGNYGLKMHDFKINGRLYTDNNIGIRAHECGTSRIYNMSILNVGICIQALGCIGSKFFDNYLSVARIGIIVTYIAPGTPANSDDITLTGSPVGLSGNASMVYDNWLSAMSENPIWFEGGLGTISGNIFQAVPNGGAGYDGITVLNGNESFDYGGGCIIERNWFEGLNCRSAIRVQNTRDAVVRKNFINGEYTPDGTVEQGIVLLNCDDAEVVKNTVRGYFSRTTTEGRLSNSGIYVHSNCRPYTCDIRNNYLTKNTCNIYVEGMQEPTVQKVQIPHHAYVNINEGANTAVVAKASNNFITSVTQVSEGLWTITYAFNRDSSSFRSVLVTPVDATGQISACIYDAGDGYDSVCFMNVVSGVAEDPAGFTIAGFFGWQGV